MQPTETCSSNYRLFSCRPVALLVTVLILGALTGCGSAPVQEMSEARQAIEAARVAGAEELAPESYDKAQTHLKTAEELLDNRHFQDARENAALARDEAKSAREEAQKAAE
jgi:hypothetical protein